MTIQILIGSLGGLLLAGGAAWALVQRMGSQGPSRPRSSDSTTVDDDVTREEAYQHLIWLTEYARDSQDDQFVGLCQKAFVRLTAHVENATGESES